MARSQSPPSLYDPRNGDDPITVTRVALDTSSEPMQSNRFAIYWVDAGAGTVWADLAEHAFGPRSLLFFTPYQRVRLVPSRRLRGTLIQFHANFLCVETFHAETGCSGVLFNDPFGSPAVTLDVRAKIEVPELIHRIGREHTERGTGYTDAMVAYLKLLLIVATRIKTPRECESATAAPDPRHALLATLKTLVEEHYRTLHAPSQYAALLHVTPKTLNRLVRAQLGKTMTDVIRERMLIHAKWNLLHTLKPVKEVAAELGFDDELYFSRLFKKATGCAPTFFREFETAIRNGSNLSMPLSRTTIPPDAS